MLVVAFHFHSGEFAVDGVEWTRCCAIAALYAVDAVDFCRKIESHGTGCAADSAIAAVIGIHFYLQETDFVKKAEKQSERTEKTAERSLFPHSVKDYEDKEDYLPDKRHSGAVAKSFICDQQRNSRFQRSRGTDIGAECGKVVDERDYDYESEKHHPLCIAENFRYGTFHLSLDRRYSVNKILKKAEGTDVGACGASEERTDCHEKSGYEKRKPSRILDYVLCRSDGT